MKDALIKLNDLVDESDPDTDLPNIVHAFQTAERIRQDHPDDDWFHLTGLIHDLGKVCSVFSFYSNYGISLINFEDKFRFRFCENNCVDGFLAGP